MKTNIIKTEISLTKLAEEINNYAVINNIFDEDIYLIMNNDTRDLIGKECFKICNKFCMAQIDDDFYFLDRYLGHKILIDNELPLGEVDIR